MIDWKNDVKQKKEENTSSKHLQIFLLKRWKHPSSILWNVRKMKKFSFITFKDKFALKWTKRLSLSNLSWPKKVNFELMNSGSLNLFFYVCRRMNIFGYIMQLFHKTQAFLLTLTMAQNIAFYSFALQTWGFWNTKGGTFMLW